ncbi:hypothetical protein HOY80DRAFT_1055700 [Tuber brumale]|nr:hypothetical protein HOY80DRAFT_1055700 [Tuber brumale]
MANWFLSQQFFNAKVPAYKCLPGLIGFRRLMEFGLYRPGLFSEWPALARPTAYQQPGPFGTLGLTETPTPLLKHFLGLREVWRCEINFDAKEELQAAEVGQIFH